MRILITNDDGIHALGLKILKKLAEQIAGKDGEVWTVAPLSEQSGTSHSVSFVRPFMISQISEREFAVEGTPADCVLAGIYNVMQPHKPDLVLSGVNQGNNSGENTLYSGTVGAAIEASLQGITGIALSQYYGSNNLTLNNPFEAAETFGTDAVKIVLANLETNIADYPLLFNINFPPCSASQVEGIRASEQGIRSKGTFNLITTESPSKKKFLWIKSGPQDIYGRTGSDISDNLNRFVSITPMRANLTDQQSLEKLRRYLPCQN